MFSKKTKLCVDALIVIGSDPWGTPVTSKALAERLAISTSHVESIMRLLSDGGFVRSARGPGGGYRIARDPDQISVWSVVSAVGNPDEAKAPRTNKSSLSDSLENSLHHVAQRYLSSRTIAEFLDTDDEWNTRSAQTSFGLGIGPKPQILKPIAPNSVFQLSSFLLGTAA